MKSDSKHTENISQVNPILCGFINIDIPLFILEKADMIHYRALALNGDAIVFQSAYGGNSSGVQYIAWSRQVCYPDNLYPAVNDFFPQFQNLFELTVRASPG